MTTIGVIPSVIVDILFLYLTGKCPRETSTT